MGKQTPRNRPGGPSLSRAISLAAGAALLVASCSSPISPDRRGSLALTFDDGPNEPYTGQILDLLDEAGVKATFFLVGRNAALQPEAAAAVAARGHALGSHTWGHRHLRDLPRETVAEELDRGRRAVEAAAGRGTGLFRCPYGEEPPFLGELCRERGLRLVRWSVDGEDWRGLSARAIADRIIQGARDGDVVLLHDGEGASQGTDRSRTVEAVRILLAEMTAGGWRFVTVPELD